VVGHLDEDVFSHPSDESHLAECDSCRDQVELVASIGLAAPEAAPSPDVLRRLLDSVQPGRFALVVDKLARLFDLTRQHTRSLLDQLDSQWLDGPSPGIWLQHIQPGPRLAGHYAGFFRISPGTVFPAHRHLGPESMLVLEGSVRVSSGQLVGDGEVLESSAGSAHGFIGAGDDDCTVAVVQEGGFEFGITL
jgi:anti-sigma factor ChrR (cupin superfamily)